MAVTSAQAVNDLVAYLKASEFVTGPFKVNGKVYPMQRPLDSQKEDIVVNALTLSREPVQEGMLNVNVYVPNRPLQNGARVDNSQPDMARLTTLAGIGNTVLENHWYSQGNIHFELQSDKPQEDGEQHYINFRVIFRALNV